jgi:predicted SAM-dependent methyltransferase
MNKLNYLNVGCGLKFHKSWVNVDMVSLSPFVQAHNILNGFPFPENSFDVVYHSHVVEHIPKEKAIYFLKECFRVLKPGGVLRVVCPDLENIAKEYIRCLDENIQNSNDVSNANYDWILLEMYDQTVRNEPGGGMVKFLECPSLPNKDYIIERIGYVGQTLIENKRTKATKSKYKDILVKIKQVSPKVGIQYGIRQLKNLLSTKAMRIGSFRLGGEIHMWMYDRFSLSRLLSQVGFRDIENLNAYKSSIPEWEIYELDIKNGKVFDPTSLFMEAKKPIL